MQIGENTGGTMRLEVFQGQSWRSWGTCVEEKEGNIVHQNHNYQSENMGEG